MSTDQFQWRQASTSVRTMGAALFALAFSVLTSGAAPTAKNGDGTLSVSPAAVAAASAGNRLEFQFRNANRGAFQAGSQFELTIPAGWTAPQVSDSAAPGYMDLCSVSGSATASVSSVSGSGPWTVTVDFTAAKGAANGFGLAYGGVSAPLASGTYGFAARTRQAGGTFVALGASPVVEVTQAQALVTLGNLIQTYDGTPRAVTVATEPVGLAVTVAYDGSPSAPVATGFYAVVATVVDPVYEGSVSGTLVVREAGGAEPVIGRETFEYFPHEGSGYESGTFLGQDGSTWTYAKARGDLSIAGRSPTLEKAKGAFLRSGTISGGVGAISLKYRKAGNQGVAFGVCVNGTSVGTISGGDGAVQTWTSGPVDVSGDVVLTITNNVNGGAVTVDDVEWTGCKAPATVSLADLAQTYDGTPRTVVATTVPAGLVVELTYDGFPTAPAAAGTYAVVAAVVDDVYAGSASGTLTVAKADQTIAFAEIADPAEFQTIDLSASAASGLPVSFAVGYGPAEIAESGASLSFSGTGRVSIVVSQAGNGNWNAAPDLAREFDVLPALALGSENVNVRENGEGRLFVRLNGAPASNVTVSVARVGGDADLRVKSGSILVFSPANWNWWQAATLAATNDEDKVGGTATFRVSLPGYEPQLASAKELDDDIGENLALATNGAAISGGSNAGRSIDGIHASSGNYGSTVWTNEPPGTMTLALKAPSTVSRIRLLNWNWLYPVLHRYTIESSMDGTDWTLLVDARAEDRHGWDDWEIPEQAARYLRFTGLSNSANRLVCVSEWEVYGKRIPAPAAVTLQNLRQTYDGTPKQVAVETDPPNLPVAVAYDAAPSRRSVRALEPVLPTGTEPPVAAGVYAVLAEVSGDDYAGFAEGTLVVEKAAQSLAFPNPGPQLATDRVALQAEASSGLPVSYAVTAGPASLDETGTRLTFSGTGTVSVVASQAGDENWNPAPDVSVSFDVTCPGLCAVLSQTNVNVREGGEGRFFVRLNLAPTANVQVAISRLSGSTNVAVAGGATLTFKPSNWNVWQPVTLSAAADANGENETAEIWIAGFCPTGRTVTATVLDDDVGENLALASGGAVVSGMRGYRLADAIDGVHAVSTNYAFTTWTSVPPGTITLDLRAAMTVSRIRLLTWDWTYRDHRYVIESSVDGATWSTLVDARADARRGWDDWPVADETIRYLRFTGLENSANSAVCVPEWEVYGARPVTATLQLSQAAVGVREGGEGRFFVRLAQAPASNVVVRVERIAGAEDVAIQSGATLTFKPSNWSLWQKVTLVQADDGNADGETATFRVSTPDLPACTVDATALDDDIGENLALASGGATLTGGKAFYLPYVNDGVHADGDNYGYTVWTNDPPGTMTLDLQTAATVSRVRILNWDWTYRTHQYTIEASADGETWSILADASEGTHQGWEEWAVADESIRYLRFTGLSNSANTAVCISELEVYGTRPVADRHVASAKAAAPAVSESDEAGGFFLESEPVMVLTSDGAGDETGWNAVDGDDETAWVGQKAGGGYVVIEYQPPLTLTTLEVDMAEGSLTNVQVLVSADARNWQPLPDDVESNPISLNYLWLVFPDDGTEAVPQILEIVPNP